MRSASSRSRSIQRSGSSRTACRRTRASVSRTRRRLQAALVSDPAAPTPVSPDTLTWTVVGGTLPPGLTLSNGIISGTPTTEGAYQFQVQVSLDTRKHLQTYTLTVRKPLAIVAPKPFATSPQPTPWEVGVPFSAKLAASGGNETYTWSLLSGALPAGFALAADGTVAGTTRTPGTYTATLRLADTEGRTADYAANIVVAPRLAVSTLVLRPGSVGRLYRARVASYRWRAAEDVEAHSRPAPSRRPLRPYAGCPQRDAVEGGQVPPDVPDHGRPQGRRGQVASPHRPRRDRTVTSCVADSDRCG